MSHTYNYTSAHFQDIRVIVNGDWSGEAIV